MKKISIPKINEIKAIRYKIFDEEVKSDPDKEKLKTYNEILKEVLKKYSKEERLEILEIVTWSRDKDIIMLKEKGWKIARYESKSRFD